MPVGEFQTSLVTFWFSWYNRNLGWHDGNIMDVYETRTKILFFIKRTKTAHSVYQTYLQSDSLTWAAPTKDFVKVNCDGT